MNAGQEIKRCETLLKLKGYSPKTQKSYLSCLSQFFLHFDGKDFSKLIKDDIEFYLLQLLETRNLSYYSQSQIISAVKFYYEKVLKRKKTVYNLPRSKKPKILPKVLSKREVKKILEIPVNLKHKAMLYFVYSGGLRVSEIARLKVEDIQSDRMFIHIRRAKGKKDRYVPLSFKCL